MKLKCKHCLFTATSLLIDKEKAMAEVMIAFSKHTMDPKAHPDTARQIMRDTMKITSLATTVVMIAKHSTLLDLPFDPDDYLSTKFDEIIDEMEKCLGVEVVGIGDLDTEGPKDDIPGQQLPVMVDSQSAPDSTSDSGTSNHPAD